MPERRTLWIAAWALWGTILAQVILAGTAHAAVGDAVAMNLWFFVVNLVYAIAAIVALFLVLRFRDRLLKVKFRDTVIPIIHRSGVATAIYYGVWVFAGAVILSRAFA